MKLYGIFFCVLCLVLAGNCEDGHHIEQRVLEKKTNLKTTLSPKNPKINITKNNTTKFKDVKESTEDSETSTRAPDPSQILEQKLDKLAYLPAASNTAKTIKTVVSVAVSQLDVGKLLNNSEVANFNDSSLLTTNCSEPSLNHPDTGVVLSNISTTGIEAPEVFPNGTSLNGTKIIEGDAKELKTWIAHQNNSTGNRTIAKIENQTDSDTSETRDLLNKTIRDYALKNQHRYKIPESDNFNDDTELIENGQNTEDQLRSHNESDSKTDDDSGYQQRYLAAVLVSSLVAASVLCYAALLIWRRYLENRYGSRTMLVNEEEFDDLRHFSI